MANRDAMPTRGPVEIPDNPFQCDQVFVNGTLICDVAGEVGDDPEVDANMALIAAAFNSSTAAADLGFDPVAAIEALPELLKKLVDDGCEDINCGKYGRDCASCAILTAARTRGGER